MADVTQGPRRRLVVIFVGVAVLAIVGSVLAGMRFGSATTLGTLTISNELQIEGSDPAGITPVAQVRDQFTGGGTTNLNGLVTTFNSGSGSFTTPAPDWSVVRSGAAASANAWQRVGGYARRNEAVTPTNYSMALIPWLTRKSTATLTFTEVDTAGADRTFSGIVLNSDSTGSSGIVAAVECNGPCVGRLLEITGNNSSTVCAGPTPALRSPANTTADVTISNFTNTPGAGGDDITATFTQAGGTGPHTLTCEPGAALMGGFSGLFAAFASDTTRFDNPLFSYS